MRSTAKRTRSTKTTKSKPESLSEPPFPQAEALDKLLDEWMADESGYDESTWPQLKRALGKGRTPGSKLFRE